MNLEDAAKQLNALGNPTRLQVCRMLVRAGDAGLSVRQLRERLDIAASTLSHHLDRLIWTGLVTEKRRTLICRANFRAIELSARLSHRRMLRGCGLSAMNETDRLSDIGRAQSWGPSSSSKAYTRYVSRWRRSTDAAYRHQQRGTYRRASAFIAIPKAEGRERNEFPKSQAKIIS